MNITGLGFAGTSTSARPDMAAFVRDVLGLAPDAVDGMEADTFALSDGSRFVVASPDGMGPTERTLGFLVDDVAAAAVELRAAGVEADDEISENASYRYLHFRAPDGCLYELVEQR